MEAIIDITLSSDDELNALGETAREEISALRSTESDLAADAEAKRAAFESDPSEASFAAREVAAQKAKNATRAREACEAEHAPIFLELSRRAQLRRRDELRQLMDYGAPLRESATRVAALLERFESELTSELETIAALARDVSLHVDEANGLESAIGDRRRYSRPTLGGIVQTLAEALPQSSYPNERSFRLTFPPLDAARSMTALEMKFPSPLVNL